MKRRPEHSSLRVRIAGTLILLTIAWPAVHYLLVTRFDVNPWKLGGMAMYTTTHRAALALRYRGADGVERSLDLDSLDHELQIQVRHHQRRRATLGRFHRLYSLARAVFSSRPDVTELIVTATVERLDATSGTFRTTSRSYRYARP